MFIVEHWKRRRPHNGKKLNYLPEWNVKTLRASSGPLKIRLLDVKTIFGYLSPDPPVGPTTFAGDFASITVVSEWKNIICVPDKCIGLVAFGMHESNLFRIHLPPALKTTNFLRSFAWTIERFFFLDSVIEFVVEVLERHCWIVIIF